jgi:hypothetical protein
MPPTPEEQEAAEAAAKAEEDRISRIVNAAITAHSKRQAAATEKLISDAVAKAVEAFAAAAPKPQAQGTQQNAAQTTQTQQTPAPAPSAEMKQLQDQIEELKRKNTESEKRAKDADLRSRQDKAVGVLRGELERVGIKGARAEGVIAVMERRGALKYDDEGNAKLTISRVRQKGADEEAREYSDFARAVDDWKDSAEAKEFLPPPPSVRDNNGRTVVRGKVAPISTEDKMKLTDGQLIGRAITKYQQGPGKPIEDTIER